MTDETEYWDSQAATFDEQPDHGLRDPRVRDAWRRLLLGRLPAAPAAVADLGCGTGSLSALLADAGYAVTGAGLPGAVARAAVLRHRAEAVLTPLDDPDLWGGPIRDERYLLVSAR